MLYEHRGHRPRIDPSAYVAPDATICGDVRIGPECRVLFGARLVAEGGPVDLDDHVVVMENAVLRGTSKDPVSVGSHSLVGPHAYVVGATVEDECFIATGSSVFNGARIGTRSEVRINATVHLRTVLPPASTVPIGWIAVGDPAEILSPDRHEEIWEIQKALDFPGYVFGLDRDDDDLMVSLTERYARALGRHRGDLGEQERQS